MILGITLESWYACYPLIRDLVALQETTWFNPGVAPVAQAIADPGLTSADIAQAAARFDDLDGLVHAFLSHLRQALGLSDTIELKVGDALDLPFADNSLTMAVSRATLHHLPDKVKSLTEMYRVLQPGGVGLVHDMRRDVAPDLLEKFTQMRASVGYPPTHVEEKVTLQEARELVIEAGLEHCTVVTSPRSGMGALGFEILIKKPLLA